MIKISKTTIVIAAAGYGLYHFFSTGNVTIFPPTKNDVRRAIKKVQPELLTKGELNVPSGCGRIGGTAFKDGVYSCQIELNKNYAGVPGMDKVTLVKVKGEWVWKR